MFGSKFRDNSKELEQMRQAAKPAERANEQGDTVREEAGTTPPLTQPLPRMTSNITVASMAPVRPISSKSEPTPPEKCASVVSVGSTWQGTLTIDGSVRIDGHLSGEIEAKGTVHVSEDAQVDAKVRAAFVIIAGKFQGQVHCTERLEIMPSGQVKAELTTKSLVVHEGAFTEGQIHMLDEKATHAVGSDGSAKSADKPADDGVKAPPVAVNPGPIPGAGSGGK